jgi:multisubunit Na+/H+ antiporter MnhB subunit
MRQTLEAGGFLTLVAGLSALINHFWSGWHIFNLVNGILLPRLGLLAAFELYVDLAVAALGLGIMIGASALSVDGD